MTSNTDERLIQDCECLIECDGKASLGGGEICRADRLRTLRELNAPLNTDGAAQGEWEDSASGAIVKVVSEGQFLVDKGFHVGREVRMADARYVTELERKAQMADVLAKALEAIASLDHVELRAHGFSVGDKAIGLARAALAQYHAATEEATR